MTVSFGNIFIIFMTKHIFECFFFGLTQSPTSGSILFAGENLVEKSYLVEASDREAQLAVTLPLRRKRVRIHSQKDIGEMGGTYILAAPV